MRTAIVGLLCALLLGCSSGEDAPAWAVSAGGLEADQATASATFGDRSCVVAGHFQGTARFGAGEANQTDLVSAGAEDVFVARYHADGTLAWAKRAGGTDTAAATGAASLKDGSVLVTGHFVGTATFGPGETGQTSVTSDGEADAFLAKHNPDGTLAWVKRAGGTPWLSPRGVARFADGSCVVTGYYSGTVTFGPGEPGATNLVAASTTEAFVARYNVNGTLAWAKRAGGTEPCTGNGIASFANGSCVAAVRTEGTATFGPGEANETQITSAGATDITAARYNANGTLAWARRAGGAEGDTPWGAATFSDGSCVISGNFTDTATFGSGETNETELLAVGEWDVFLAKFNSNGTLAWAKKAGGTEQEVARDVAGFADGSCVITGRFRGVATFGPGEPGATIVTSNGGTEIFVARYRSNGTLHWAEGIGSTESDQGEDVSSHGDGSFIVAGRFASTAIFHEGDTDETQLTSAGGTDIFVARFRAGGE